MDLGGFEKVAEETVSEQLSKIDARILDWTIGALGEDGRLETFFDLTPGFLNSKLVMNLRGNFNDELRCKFADALVGLLGRTLLSKSISDLAKSRRLINFMTVADLIPDFCNVSYSVYGILDRHLDQVPQSIETGNALAHWCSSKDDVIADAAHCIVANTLVNARERDDRWKALAKRVFCLPEYVVGDYIAHEDNTVLLSILIFTTRKAFWSASWTSRILLALSKFSIHDTLPGLQHGFCALWNEIARGVRKGTATFDAINVLRGVRHAYIALHRDTDAAPPAFTDSIDHLPYERSLYPLCNIASHRRNSSAEGPHTPASPYKSLNTEPGQVTLQSTSNIHPSVAPQVLLTPLVPTEVSGQLDQSSLSAGDISTPDDLTPDSRTEETSQAPPATPLTFSHLDPVPVIITPPDGSDLPSLSPLDPGNVPNALQYITSALAASFPRLPESRKQRDIVAPCAASEISEIPSAGPTAVPTPASGFAACPPPEHVPHERRAELLALLRGASTSCPTGNATLPLLRVRGLANRGNKCFAITVLHLLAHCPPFWNLFRQLGRFKAPERGGCSTPLVDATVRFLGEFVYEEKPSPTQQPQQAVSGKSREEEEEEKEVYDLGPFEPTYLYDAMKEKNQLDKMLNGGQQDAEEFFGFYLDALEEELQALLDSISPPASAAPKVEGPEEGSQSGEVFTISNMAESVKSPIMRLFGGKSFMTRRVPDQPSSGKVDNWKSLKLYIQDDWVNTIERALVNLSQPQLMQDGSTEQVLIKTLPPLLVLHLVRFQRGTDAGDTVKIGKPIQFLPELEIPTGHMASTAPGAAQPARYTLLGVLYHHGESAGSGHYTVDVVHPNQDGLGKAWLRINDDMVNEVGHDVVFDGHDEERADGRCAYMLVYRRAAPALGG
ncbi:hypothetical protein BJV74DRAFT_538642 [Russula compacta]|nr:hypothetical protein BJV74DRAFT_538642 [Russula compacta]